MEVHVKGMKILPEMCLPLPEQGKSEFPWHFLALSSTDNGQECGCSHFFPVHPSLQSHLPQLHCPWPSQWIQLKISLHTDYKY